MIERICRWTSHEATPARARRGGASLAIAVAAVLASGTPPAHAAGGRTALAVGTAVASPTASRAAAGPGATDPVGRSRTASPPARLSAELDLDEEDQTDGCHLVGGSFEAGSLRARLVEVATTIGALGTLATNPQATLADLPRALDSSFDDVRAPSDALRAAVAALAAQVKQAGARSGVGAVVLDVCQRALAPLRAQADDDLLTTTGGVSRLQDQLPTESDPHVLALTLLGLGLVVALVQQGRALGGRD